MLKNLFTALVLFGALALLVFGTHFFATPTVEEAPDETTPDVCIQVITPARNEITGEIREFPTPCDVPEGWYVIQNDIPGMDLPLEEQ